MVTAVQRQDGEITGVEPETPPDHHQKKTLKMATEIVRSPKATRVADISPDAFDSMSSAGQHHYLVECAIRHLPARNSTDESRRCLNQLLEMFADTIAAEREREAECKLESEMRAQLGPDDFVEFCRMVPDFLPMVHKDAGNGLRLVWSAPVVEMWA